jgi:hypothetical protein
MTLRSTLIAVALAAGLGAGSAHAQGWQCSSFGGYCPEGACDIRIGRTFDNVWPTSCGLECVCDQWELAYYTLHPEFQTCLELCDYGWDGWCDCGWLP